MRRSTMTGIAIIQICSVVLLVALVQAQNDGCFNVVKCGSREARKAAFSVNRTEMCRYAPTIIECALKENSLCDDPEMAAVNNKQISMLINSTKSCDNTGTTTIASTYRVTFKQCAEQFTSCYTSEFQIASDQKNNEVICSTLPGIIDCLERALSLCQASGQQFEMLSAQVEDFRRQLPSSKCPSRPDADSSKYDSANFLATSIIQTCIALLLATLLH